MNEPDGDSSVGAVPDLLSVHDCGLDSGGAVLLAELGACGHGGVLAANLEHVDALQPLANGWFLRHAENAVGAVALDVVGEAIANIFPVVKLELGLQVGPH